MITVFLADDHAVVRDGLRALLEANPEIVVVGDAADGQAAVEQALRLQPAVVVMDISMPGLNGIEATEAIVGAAPEVRVIILSMLGTPEHIFRALQAGASGYMLKESAGREVMAAVRAVAAGDVYFSQAIAKTLIADYVDYRGKAQKGNALDGLSEREREVLRRVVAGKTSAEIARELFLSPKTVESYRSRVMRKLGMPDLASLIKFAVQQGL